MIRLLRRLWCGLRGWHIVYENTRGDDGAFDWRCQSCGKKHPRTVYVLDHVTKQRIS